MASLNQIVIQAIIAMDIHRRGIITEKVKLFGLSIDHSVPPFYLVKPKLLALTPLPPKEKSAKIAP